MGDLFQSAPRLLVLLLPLGLLVVIPLVAILSEHQQKMAKILANRGEQEDRILEELRLLNQKVESLELQLRSQSAMPDRFLANSLVREEQATL